MSQSLWTWNCFVMNPGIVLVSILLGLFVGLGSTEKILRYMPTEYKLWSDNEVLNYTFAMDEKVPYVNISIKVLQDVKNLDVHVEGQIIGKKDPSHFFNFNATYSFCSVLAWKNTSPFGMIAFAYLKEFGNVAESCPIHKGEYSLKRIWFPEDPITSSLPEVDFNFNIKVFATTVDGTHVDKLAMNDYWKGEALVRDVSNVKKSVLSFIPKMSMMG